MAQQSDIVITGAATVRKWRPLFWAQTGFWQAPARERCCSTAALSTQRFRSGYAAPSWPGTLPHGGCRHKGRSPKEAAAGTLLLMVGAEAGDDEAVLPLLNQMAAEIFHCGGPGTGIAMKVIGNLHFISLLWPRTWRRWSWPQGGANQRAHAARAQGWRSNNPPLSTTIPAQANARLPTAVQSLDGTQDLGLGENLAARLGVPLFSLS